MMWKDPIVEETRRLRKELADECRNDPQAIATYIREKERESPRCVVTRRSVDNPDAAAS